MNEERKLVGLANEKWLRSSESKMSQFDEFKHHVNNLREKKGDECFNLESAKKSFVLPSDYQYGLMVRIIGLALAYSYGIHESTNVVFSDNLHRALETSLSW